MRSLRLVAMFAVGACVALAGTANAQIKGSGKTSMTIVKMPAPGPTTPTPKTAGSVSSKAAAAKVGLPPTGGGSFALKLAKDVGDPAKPGFGSGDYLIEVESAPTPGGDVVGNPLAAAFFIAFTIDPVTLKCTIQTNPAFDTGGASCGGVGQPLCAPAAVGKCSATLYQVAGTLLAATGTGPNQPFAGQFRIKSNPDTTTCKTGVVVLGAGASVCRTGTLLGVAGVALGTAGVLGL